MFRLLHIPTGKYVWSVNHIPCIAEDSLGSLLHKLKRSKIVLCTEGQNWVYLYIDDSKYLDPAITADQLELVETDF